MNRRQLLARFAAIAAAVTLAPKVEPAAAEWDDVLEFNEPLGQPMTHEELARRFAVRSKFPEDDVFWCIKHLDPITGAGHWHNTEDAIAEARAEGYERGRAVAEARQESRMRAGEFHVARIGSDAYMVESGAHPPLREWLEPGVVEDWFPATGQIIVSSKWDGDTEFEITPLWQIESES